MYKRQRTASRTLKAHESTSLDAILEVEQPKLWTVLNDKPALYELITRVYRDGQLAVSYTHLRLP